MERCPMTGHRGPPRPTRYSLRKPRLNGSEDDLMCCGPGTLNQDERSNKGNLTVRAGSTDNADACELSALFRIAVVQCRNAKLTSYTFGAKKKNGCEMNKAK
jgi:hypothetical protein